MKTACQASSPANNKATNPGIVQPHQPINGTMLTLRPVFGAMPTLVGFEPQTKQRRLEARHDAIAAAKRKPWWDGIKPALSPSGGHVVTPVPRSCHRTFFGSKLVARCHDRWLSIAELLPYLSLVHRSLETE